MARLELELYKGMDPYGMRLDRADVLVLNKTENELDLCLAVETNGQQIFQFVEHLAPLDQKWSLMHIRNIGIYEQPIKLTISTSMHVIYDVSVRIILKNTKDEIVGLINEKKIDRWPC